MKSFAPRPACPLQLLPGSQALWLALLLTAASPAPGAIPDGTIRAQGAWTNLTFGSTGAAKLSTTVSGASAILEFDLDGYVFGMADPPSTNVPGTVQGYQILIDSKGVGIYGDIKGVIDVALGTIHLTLTNVPGGYIRLVTLTGTLVNGLLNAQYTVDFYGSPGPTNPAHGVMVATRLPDFAVTRASREGANMVLEWVGGKPPYQVSTRTNLAIGTWSNIGSTTTNTNAMMALPKSGSGFFRVSGQP